jgi:hypothetical protein
VGRLDDLEDLDLGNGVLPLKEGLDCGPGACLGHGGIPRNPARTNLKLQLGNAKSRRSQRLFWVQVKRNLRVLGDFAVRIPAPSFTAE